ncbi:MAG: hypothetical protein AAGC70_15860 [Pseudomonadota bacterium]
MFDSSCISRIEILTGRWRTGLGRVLAISLASMTLYVSAAVFTSQPAGAQSATNRLPWPRGIELRGPIDDAPNIQPETGSANTTVLPRKPASDSEAKASRSGQLTLEAILTNDGQPIGDNLIWRIFAPHENPSEAPRLLRKLISASPTITLPQGTYFVNASYGRAHLTRRIVVLDNGSATERFVLNAGGLRASVVFDGGRKPNPRAVSIDVFSDETDQAGNRRRIVTGARPSTIIRLNSGIYHIQSRIGRANAYVRSEVSVEAGKLSEVKIVHKAAPITFKLVTTPGGEAIAGTRWTVLAKTGNVVRESVGALPTHVLALGAYTVIAQSRGQVFRKSFDVATSQPTDVEVLSTGTTSN